MRCLYAPQNRRPGSETSNNTDNGRPQRTERLALPRSAGAHRLLGVWEDGGVQALQLRLVAQALGDVAHLVLCRAGRGGGGGEGRAGHGSEGRAGQGRGTAVGEGHQEGKAPVLAWATWHDWAPCGSRRQVGVAEGGTRKPGTKQLALGSSQQVATRGRYQGATAARGNCHPERPSHQTTTRAL